MLFCFCRCNCCCCCWLALVGEEELEFLKVPVFGEPEEVLFFDRFPDLITELGVIAAATTVEEAKESAFVVINENKRTAVIRAIKTLEF